MRLWTREQAQAIDQRVIQNKILSFESLVGSAGAAVAKELSLNSESSTEAIIFLIGPGTNGIDGLIAALEFQRLSPIPIRIFFQKQNGPGAHPLWSSSLKKLSDSGVQCLSVTEREGRSSFEEAMSEQNFVWVDAVFGTGISRPVENPWDEIFKKLNDSNSNVISIDIPSGIDCNTGCELGVAVRSRRTFTLGALKPGLFLRKGLQNRGKIHLLPLPIPKELSNSIATDTFLVGKNAARKMLPTKSLHSNKYSSGEMQIIGGSEKYRGAGILTARAALRSGMGILHLYSENGAYPEWFSLPETILHPISKWSEIDFLSSKKSQTWVVGPGLDMSQWSKAAAKDWEDFFKKLVARSSGDIVVLDAGALGWLAEQRWSQRKLAEPIWSDSMSSDPLSSVQKWFEQFHRSWILTPHSGEAAKLLNCRTEEIEKDRVLAARTLAIQYSAIVVLKGAKTVVADSKSSFIISSGNSALAKAGTGDVLAGIIGALAAQLKNPLKAAVLGAWVHGALADEWAASEKDKLSLLPSDLIEMMPALFFKLRQSKL